MTNNGDAISSTPNVSVIIPTYNRERFISRAIESVLVQTYEDWEVLISDDASTDDTCAIVESYDDKRIILLRSSVNRGAGAARNHAISMARGTYVAFLDSDDQWLPHKLELQVNAFENLPNTVGLVYGDSFIEDYHGNRSRYGFGGVAPFQGFVFNDLLDHFIIQTSTAMIPRSVLDQVGVFDEELRSGQDWDLFVRIAHAFQVRVIHEPIAVYTKHPGNLHWDLDRAAESQLAASYKLINLFGLSPKTMSRTLSRHHIQYGRYLLKHHRARESRAHFWKAFLLRPKRYNALVFLALSVFGGSPYQAQGAIRRKRAA